VQGYQVFDLHRAFSDYWLARDGLMDPNVKIYLRLSRSCKTCKSLGLVHGPLPDADEWVTIKFNCLCWLACLACNIAILQPGWAFSIFLYFPTVRLVVTAPGARGLLKIIFLFTFTKLTNTNGQQVERTTENTIRNYQGVTGLTDLHPASQPVAAASHQSAASQ